MAIKKQEANGNNITITTQFSNKVDGVILNPFYLKEIGLYAKLTDENGNDDANNPETLVAYAYALGEDQGDRIPGALTEFIINWPCTVSNTSNVTVTTASIVYVPQDEFDAAVLNLQAAIEGKAPLTHTHTEDDITIGTNNSAGRKAFYIKAIDTANYRIYLSNEQVNPPACVNTKGSDIEYDETFERPAYDNGDEFSIIYNSHYNFIGTIVKIVNNVVWYSSQYAIPEPTLDEWEGEGAFTFHVPSKPHIGVVELGVNSFAVGEDNKANGRNTFVSGINNVASGDYGMIGGKDNKGGFGTLIGGTGNVITGNSSFGAGSNNTVTSNYSGVIGRKIKITEDKNNSAGTSNFGIGNNNVITDSNKTFTAGVDNIVEGEHVLTVGDKNTSTEGGPNIINIGFYNKNKGSNAVTVGVDLSVREGTTEQTIIGRANEPDADASIILADGNDEKGVHNAMVVKKTGEVIFNSDAIAEDFKDKDGISYAKADLSNVIDVETAQTNLGLAYFMAEEGDNYGEINVTIPGITELKTGVVARVISPNDYYLSTDIKLNVNNLGLAPVRRVSSDGITTTAFAEKPTSNDMGWWMNRGVPFEVVYQGNRWLHTSYQKPSAKDLKGVVPVESGGTGNDSVDTTPTSGSTKMVTSDGIYNALQSKLSASDIPLKKGSATDSLVQVCTSGTQPIVASAYTGGIALGNDTENRGYYSLVGGHGSTVNTAGSYACISYGYNTIANDYGQVSVGRYNVNKPGATSEADTTGDAFIVGIGTGSTARSNAFRVSNDGKCRGLSSWGSSGADYAEYFEWSDGNPDNEDRRGLFVTLDGNKIRRATSKDDYILGVISATPVVVGNTWSDEWQGRFLTDIYGERLKEIVEVPETKNEETGEIIPAHTETHFILNPEYDPEKPYVSREERKEWGAVGMVGQLVVNDDGTCKVNGYCKVTDDAIATKADGKTDYRVIERLDDTHIRIVVK